VIGRLALAAVLLAPAVARAQGTPEPSVGARLAVQVEAARGHTGAGFRNGLAGLRVDLVFTPQVSLGAYAGVANLKGKDGRTQSALGYAQLEYLAPLAPHFLNLRVPLRFATGYLARNGPVVRASLGLAAALSPRVDLIAELFTPMAWVTHDQTLFSTNVSLELAMRF
jgi:hypothetical protein